MRKLTTLTLSAALLGLVHAGAPAVSSASTAAPPAAPAPAAARQVETPFAFYGSGFGTKVIGGDVPADSARTGGKVLSCTNLGGITRGNEVVEAEVPGTPLRLGVATTRLRTVAQPGRRTYASVSRQTIARLQILETPLGSLSIAGLASTARAESVRGELDATTNLEVGRLTLQPPGGGAPQVFPGPTPNNPVTIPGLATVELGKPTTRVSADEAKAFASVLKITLIPTGTKITVANARARIERGIRSGIFKGFSTGVRGKALDGALRIGKNPLLQMPCVGTRGEREDRSLVGLDIGGQIEVGAANVAHRSTNGRRAARGWERASVAEVSLGGGQLVIEAVQARAAVERTGRKVLKKPTSSVGRVTFEGEPQEFPADGPMEIPGVATLTPQVLDLTRNGVEVIGLRVDLVDGDVAQLDLATARLNIGKGKIRR